MISICDYNEDGDDLFNRFPATITMKIITKGGPFVFWGLVIGQLNMGTLMTATRPVVRIKGHNRLVSQTCFKEASVILLDPSHLNSIRCIGDGSKLIVLL